MITILFGGEFIAAATLLPILGWGLLPYTVSSFISYDLIARGAENIVVNAAILSAIFYFSAFMFLIPKYQLTGAAWAALLGESLQAVVFIYFHRSQSARL